MGALELQTIFFIGTVRAICLDCERESGFNSVLIPIRRLRGPRSLYFEFIPNAADRLLYRQPRLFLRLQPTGSSPSRFAVRPAPLDSSLVF
jgi:hypothetical protein